MKKISLIITIVTVTAASIIYALAVKSESSAAAEAVPQAKPANGMMSCCADSVVMPNKEFSQNSIYQINSSWRNQYGNKVNIGDLEGKTQVFTMVFASCTYACPVLINDMRRIENNLSKEDLKNVRFTLVSIDPERDTPERLKKFALDQNLNLARWQLLTGNRNDIDDLAALLGFRYKKEKDGSFSHSNIITILNKEGEIVHQQVGLNQDINQTVKVITNLNKKGV